MRRALLLLALTLLAGCAAVTPKPSGMVDTGLSVSAPTIRGRAVVEFTDKTVLRGHAVIVAREPAFFKITLLGPFGHTAWAMTGNEESISIYENAKSTTYRSGDPALPYRFSSRELVAYLTGTTPAVPGEMAGIEYFRTVRDKDKLITGVIKSIGGRPVLKVVLGDYRAVSGRMLPFFITISDVHRSLKISFSTIVADTAVNDASFKEKEARTGGAD